ncbi:MAG: hypothetical protein ABEJ27_01710 [Halodesulfurarchaeum sp.]
MPDDSRPNEATPEEHLPTEDPRASVEAYETEDGTVLYDAQNPLAWLKASNARSVEDIR